MRRSFFNADSACFSLRPDSAFSAQHLRVRGAHGKGLGEPVDGGDADERGFVTLALHLHDRPRDDEHDRRLGRDPLWQAEPRRPGWVRAAGKNR